MKHLLLLCDLYPPAFGPRMGYLCKYIEQYGWQPYVITERVPGFRFIPMTTHHRVEYIPYHEKGNGFSSHVRWTYRFVKDLVTKKKDRLMVERAMAAATRISFDAILVSSYRCFPLGAAVTVAKKTGLPLVIDLRDITEQYSGYEYIRHYVMRIPLLRPIVGRWFRAKLISDRNKALRRADAVTTVSPWHVKMLRPYNPRIELIYNGYDPSLFSPAYPIAERFIITYTGRLLSLSMQDPTLLFEALTLLIKQEAIDAEEISVRFYTDPASTAHLEEVVEQYHIEELIEILPFVPSDVIPALLHQSSLLLLLTNRAQDDGPKGIMTTKFFEYLAVQKPILCVRSDEGVLEAMIEKTGAGRAARNIEEVCDYLMEQYNLWKRHGYTKVDSDKALVSTFSRKEQAGQFARLLDTLVDHAS